MKRRYFIALVGGTAAAWPLSARAQQGDRIKRLGMLFGGSGPFINPKRVLEALAPLGWMEGRNLRVDLRSVGSNDPTLISPHAEALVDAAPDVIFASPATAVQVLQRLTSTIPIVFLQTADPVQAGMVQSFARPGGNITGFMSFEPSMHAKFLQLLKDIAPQLTRVAVLQTEATRSVRGGSDFATAEQASRALGVTAVALLVRDDPADIERAIAGFAREPNGGLLMPPDLSTQKYSALIAALAVKYRLPAIAQSRVFTAAGGLMSYMAEVDLHHIAGYLDRILRGARPADLPVETPTNFNLVVNRKTATALGLTLPPSLFALGEVIE